ncbi:MAG: DEAD/DEAH box helicase [Vicinamibacterales bacterium]|nr:DEAD/DEAH box helicase [Vicinamibacterales bacterium]
MPRATSVLTLFAPAVRAWFAATFGTPTPPQVQGWPAIARGESTLILAPTGSGKTLAAFLACLNRLATEPPPSRLARCRVLYVSPLKALVVDIERNLRAPIAGIAEAATALGTPVVTPEVAIRTGDTPTADRRRFLKESADILVTTPESLFMLLTSSARERLRSIDTVILDEIHALVPGKRGAHLMLSLERLEALRTGLHRRPLQRIGLSATQRPLDEVARFLGGADVSRAARPAESSRSRKALEPIDAGAEITGEFSVHGRREPASRPVTIVDASARKPLALTIDVPVEDMARPAPDPEDGTPGERPHPSSIWASIYPRLLELVRAHRSTLLFVNSRRLAERLAGALNDLAGEPVARAHHGSMAREQRAEVEALLKDGQLPALVATSSLELGIDMGAIDLVIQIEAPPSVASGLQRIGRAGHRANEVSHGVIVPKFRADLVACAAVTRAMRDGDVEATRYPRNPLDVLAQQIVAITAMDPWPVEDLYALVRRAAPFAELDRRMFDGVLDMLSGRYPSDDFAELRPRIVWDRAQGTVTARPGAVRIVIANAGTIPDRGLYGVFVAGSTPPARVGELDEEMVFETDVGDVFTLGASSWRVAEITHDRVLVRPAPGEPGAMPFWKGETVGRPAEFGRAIGQLVRSLRAMPAGAALTRLTAHHDLEPVAAENLLRYLADQAAAGTVPDDRTVVIERSPDELGDWRVCLLSPLGGRIHAAWAMAATAQIRESTGLDVDTMWTDDGFVVRFPAAEAPPDPRLLIVSPGDVEALVTRQLGASALFAGRFREAAARALLLPRRWPGRRMPLWQQRKRAADLLAVASQYGSFPIVLEAYRECLRDVFDMPALVDTLRDIASGATRVVTTDVERPSPFAASVLFGYVARYLYEGDAPLAERRAQALAIDSAQLRDLLGDAELRDLLDEDAIAAVERRLQHLDDDHKARTVDGLHDLLLGLGDLSVDELAARTTVAGVPAALESLEHDGRAIRVAVAGRHCFIATEDAARYRDALGATLPPGVPPALLEPVADPAGDLVRRYARTHGPFVPDDIVARLGLAGATVTAIVTARTAEGRLVEGAFRPGRTGREWCDAEVLRAIRRRSLAAVRHQVEPVDAAAIGRFSVAWHGIGAGRTGEGALLQAIDQLQGTPIQASVLERDILPSRVADYTPAMLDALMATGEVTWVGVEPKYKDGILALYRADQLPRLRPPTPEPSTLPPDELRALDFLRSHGASFFTAIHQGTGGGYPRELVGTLWSLVWQGLVTNDAMHALRAFVETRETREARRRRPATGSTQPRRAVPPAGEGRWSLVTPPGGLLGSLAPTATERMAAAARQLLLRHGVVMRETAAAEGVEGGFSGVYQVLTAMEAAGKARRGYFVGGTGGAQFATSEAVEMLRSMREPPAAPQAVMLATTDPANPYGAIARWPEGQEGPVDGPTGQSTLRGPTRVAGANVILVDGEPTGYLKRGERDLLLSPPSEDPRRSLAVREVARTLLRLSASREPDRRGLLIATINAAPASQHPLAHLFVEEGFVTGAMGLQAKPPKR